MYQALYDSPWVATALLAAITMVGLVVWVRRRSFLVAYTVVFTIVSLGDALRSGTWSPLHLLASPWEDAIGLGFVLLGDFRYWLLLERFAARPNAKPHDATSKKAWLSAVVWLGLVGLPTVALTKAFPKTFADSRVLYLTWEAIFLLVVAVYRFVWLPKRLARSETAAASVRKWLFDVTRFEVVMYALWATSDVLLLAGVEAALLLRIVPNILYYGVFVWFVAFRAPPEVDG